MKKRTSRSPKERSALEALGSDETREALRRLLAARPGLREEAERIAQSLLGETSLEAVAEEVEEAVRSVHEEDWSGRAGRHEWGYVEPSEAALEVLQEAVDPFLEDMKRRLELGHEAEALEILKGILLGLYRLRGEKEHEVLRYAEDFPEDAAASAIYDCRKERARGPARRGPPAVILSAEFVATRVPDWKDLVANASKERG